MGVNEDFSEEVICKLNQEEGVGASRQRGMRKGKVLQGEGTACPKALGREGT